MHNKLNKLLFATGLVVVTGQQAWAVCPPIIPTTCAATAQCSTPKNDTDAFKDVDKAFVKKVKSVHKNVMKSIDAMDAKVSKAISIYSSIKTNAAQDYVNNIKKAMEIVEKKRQQFMIEQNTLDAMQLAKPSKGFTQNAMLKGNAPSSEVMTRAIRLQLYEDHVRRTELEHEQYYSDKSNLRERAYHAGTISGIAKLYETHKDFFCNAAGANKPAGCGQKAASEGPAQGVKMGDQMVDIYLGDRTWPESQVQKSIELMQFYLGITPPDLMNPESLGTGDGQREYVTYQGKLAKNNFLTYILSYLVSKRAPTNEAQKQFVQIRQEAAGCANINDNNRKVCTYLSGISAKGSRASRAELSRALEYDRYMGPGYITHSISGTLGVEKDLTLMMVDRLQQDYEEYQMDKMITAVLAADYANSVRD